MTCTFPSAGREDRKVAQEVDLPISIQIRIFDRQGKGLRRPCHVGQAQDPQVIALRLSEDGKNRGIDRKNSLPAIRVKSSALDAFLNEVVEAARDLVGSSGRRRPQSPLPCSGWVAHGSDVRFVERL